VRFVQEADRAQADCGAAKDELAAVATWQSFLEWVKEVGSGRLDSGVREAAAAEREARDALLQVCLS
jgi:hypothetical protein